MDGTWYGNLIKAKEDNVNYEFRTQRINNNEPEYVELTLKNKTWVCFCKKTELEIVEGLKYKKMDLKVKIQKLKDVANDVVLAIRYDNDLGFELMSKEAFMETSIYIDKLSCVVSIAEQQCAELNWEDVFEFMQERDDQFEDWQEMLNFSDDDLALLEKTKRMVDRRCKENFTYFASDNVVYEC